ncbi:hypothetical protein [Streptomyces sp. WAC06614]|uniref:hypothetical protein n=1 Tax=Streptomyces sp. WAC06614 TaxID=2487416 RepID=UPI00163BAA23|nr:hypothetical protein [Streptomyces sp. WAC06614]
MTRKPRTALRAGVVVAALAAGVLAAPTAALAVEPGHTQGAGEVMRSKNAVLKLQDDGNLVLEHVSGGVLWASGTYGNPGATLAFQQDGNLVVYKKDGGEGKGGAVWSTGTWGNPGSRLDLQSDGNLVLYRQDGSPAWNTATWMTGTTLYAGWQLGAGNWTWADNAILAMEQTGKLTIRDREVPGIRFDTNTWGPGAYARLQADGNFVIYKKDGGEGKGGALWSTGTWNQPGARLVFERNGDLVLYKKEVEEVLWRSGTGR